MRARIGFAMIGLVLASAALTSCSYVPVADPVLTTRPDGTTIVAADAPTIGLSATPSVSASPELEFAGAPEGWSATVIPEEGPRDPGTAVPVDPTRENSAQPISFFHEDTGCTLTTTMMRLTAVNAGRGDLTLTQDAFRSYSSLPGAKASKEKTVSVATGTGGTIDFYSGVVTADTNEQWVAVRAVDHLLDSPGAATDVTLSEEQIAAGMTIVDSGANVSQHIPAIALQILCSTGNVEKLDLAAVLAAFTVKLTA